MSAPNPPAQTPEEVARAITDGFARVLRDTPGAAGSLELNIEYALRAAAQAARLDALPVECLNGHWSPLDEWGKQCQVCAAIQAERERIAAELRCGLPLEDVQAITRNAFQQKLIPTACMEYGIRETLLVLASRLSPAPEGTKP